MDLVVSIPECTYVLFNQTTWTEMSLRCARLSEGTFPCVAAKM